MRLKSVKNKKKVRLKNVKNVVNAEENLQTKSLKEFVVCRYLREIK